jgi:hypothetical protein
MFQEQYPYVFTFVRHPLSWYESWWKYQWGGPGPSGNRVSGIPSALSKCSDLRLGLPERPLELVNPLFLFLYLPQQCGFLFQASTPSVP